MKKLCLVVVSTLISIAATAQNKGEMYFAASIGASFGSQTSELYTGGLSTTAREPLGTSVSAQLEFAYFVANNFRLSLALGVPFTSSPTAKDGSSWLYTKTVSFQINPNIAYYVRLADRFYYTPELGFSYEIGSYKEDQTANVSYNANLSGWDVYAHLLAFEFRATQRFALGVMVGSLSYANAKIKDRTSDAYLGTGQFRFNFNSGGIAARFYF